MQSQWDMQIIFPNFSEKQNGGLPVFPLKTHLHFSFSSKVGYLL